MASGTDRHFDDEEMESYSRGVLAPAREALLEEHLLICSDCQRRVAKSDDYVRAMRRAAEELAEEGACGGKAAGAARAAGGNG
jgi:anti-sigma factor RsiW